MREALLVQLVNLVRGAWAGSQKYGALVWSGDIHSTFESFQNQFAAGLNMAIAGIPWWTTDIGGFFGANIYDKAYHEVFVRWFEYGTFCPVMRLHGDRMPHQPQHGTTGGAAYPVLPTKSGLTGKKCMRSAKNTSASGKICVPIPEP